MSRMIFGVALCFALAVASGCGSTPTPTPPAPAPAPEPEPKKEPDAPTPPPKVETPKVEAPKVVWEIDADKHAIPAAPVRGSIAGVEVTPEVGLTGEEITFRVRKAGMPAIERSVSLKLAPHVPDRTESGTVGRNWKVKAGDPPGPAAPEIWLEVDGQGIRLESSGYALTLELGPRKNGKVAGKIYLSLPDKEQTVLAGTFTTDYFRPHTEKPGPDDLPYVAGEVTVAGADPKAEVRVAYAAFPATGGVLFKELQIAADAKPVEQAIWTSDGDGVTPRTSTLTPGDGKGRPFRFEYVKLPPGRYLLSAAVVGGPAVWKWVDVPANGVLTENLALDVTKTGNLEIATPPDAKSAVFIAPADELTRPVMDPRHFESVSVQVVRTTVEVIAGKAVVKNLGAGRYEVRLGDERRFVDVAAGKTAEVNMTPAKK